MRKIYRNILILILVVTTIVCVRYVVLVNETKKQITELITLASTWDDDFTEEEATRVNEITAFLKRIDKGIFSFLVDDYVQQLPVSGGYPGQYLVINRK